MPSRPPVLAVDVGATKLAAAVVCADGSLAWQARVPTPQAGDPEEIWSALAGLVAGAPSATSLCGIGCGGPTGGEPDLVSPLNIPAWVDFPLRARMAELCGLPTWIDNDAKALALGEGLLGAAADSGNYLSMVVSSGVGGGVVLDGRLLDGRRGNAGHIGHVVVEPGGRRCACGGRGCLEAEASGRSIAAITGVPAAQADSVTIERTGTLVGRAVASVANLLDLDLATVAGSVALGFGEPFFAAAAAEIGERSRLCYSRACRIVPGGLGADGPLVGAAAVAWRGAGILERFR